MVNLFGINGCARASSVAVSRPYLLAAKCIIGSLAAQFELGSKRAVNTFLPLSYARLIAPSPELMHARLKSSRKGTATVASA